MLELRTRTIVASIWRDDRFEPFEGFEEMLSARNVPTARVAETQRAARARKTSQPGHRVRVATFRFAIAVARPNAARQRGRSNRLTRLESAC
jgi:hypothetical protein